MAVLTGYVGGETLKSSGDAVVLVPEREAGARNIQVEPTAVQMAEVKTVDPSALEEMWPLTETLVPERQEKELARKATEAAL